MFSASIGLVSRQLHTENELRRFERIYDLISFIDTAFGREPISRPVDNSSSDPGPTAPAKDWGNLGAGNRLTVRRRVPEDWRYGCWMRDC